MTPDPHPDPDADLPADVMLEQIATIYAADDDLAVDRAFANYYGRQDAWYLEGIEANAGNTGRAKFGFMFVEKEAPWLSRWGESTEAMRYGCGLEINRAFATFDACLTNGEWPSYQPHRAFPTSWQLREWGEAELEEAA